MCERGLPSLQISPEVVEAMGQLVASILSDFNVTPEMSAEAPTSKARLSVRTPSSLSKLLSIGICCGRCVSS